MARGATQDFTQNQSQAESAREVRRGYRDLQQSINRSRDDLGDFSKDSLQEALDNANLLHGKVNRPREQAKDSEVFCSLAASGVEQAKKLAAGAKSRTAKDVIRRLKLRFAAEAQTEGAVEDDPMMYDWVAAGNHCLHLFSTAPGVGCMLGAMAAKPKVRKIAERRQKTKLGALEKPKEVTNMNTEQKQETDILMEEMFEVIAKQKTAGWLELVMNHSSFSQTVENIFTLSFLVRDSKVSFTPDEASGMMVHAYSSKKAAAGGDEKERVQSMQSYGMEDWHTWKEYVAQSACLTPHRDQSMYETQANGALAGEDEGRGRAAKGTQRGSKAKRAAATDRGKSDDEELSEDDDGEQDASRANKATKRSKRQG